jgi:hypothetical protein
VGEVEIASYQTFIFSADSSAILFAQLRQGLEKYCHAAGRPVSLMADARNARIEFGREEYYFYFLLVDKDWVAEESREIANHHSKKPFASTIRDCKYRVEFYGDDDLNMDYFNDYFALIEELQKIPGIIIYDYPNGAFLGTKGSA